MQNNCKIIEIGTFLKNRDPPPLFSKFPNRNWDISEKKRPPPSVFKISKLKLGHFCYFLTPPPYWDIVPNFLYFLF